MIGPWVYEQALLTHRELAAGLHEHVTILDSSAEYTSFAQAVELAVSARLLGA